MPWVSFHAHEFEYTAGVPVEFESSPGALRVFCGTCGTSLANRRLDKPNEIVVSICSFDPPRAFTPDAHIWGSEMLPWVRLSDNLPVRPHE